MRPLGRLGVIVTATSVTVSFLTICLPVAGAIPTSPSVGTLPVGSTAWAYGALVSKGWSGSGPAGYAYKASETVGYAVILHESMGPGSNDTLQVNRTMGMILSVQFCTPSCSRPIASATVSFRAWEAVHAALELTSSGDVTISGQSYPALALVTSNVSVEVGLREATRVVVDGTTLRGHNLSADLSVNSSSVFTPALGLVPLSIPSTAEPWTASSVVAEAGSLGWSVLDRTAAGTVTLNSTQPPIPFTKAGAVVLYGNSTARTIRLGGAPYDVVQLLVVGPFSLREGFLLLPTSSDLFSAAPPSWLPSSSLNGSASVSQQSVDVEASPAIGTHLGFGGSADVWNAGASDPATAAIGSGLSPAVGQPQASGTNATALQSGPESLAQASVDQNCLATGIGCPLSSSARGLPWELIALGGIAVAAVLVGAVVVERRRLPPSPYPNSALYPPGAASGGAPGGVRRPDAPPPAEDDPLGNLW